MKIVMHLLPLLLLSASRAHGEEQTSVDEEAQIVTTCYYANAEWGTDMVNLCVEENRRVRAEVLALPDVHAAAVRRCRASAELGWSWVKECVKKAAAERQAPAR